MDERADLLAVHHLLQITHHIHVENIDRQIVVLTHTDGGQVHYLQTTCQHLLIGDLIKLRRRGILLRVGCIDTIHTRALQHHVGLDLDAAQTRARIRGEVR